jgi:hypothetical protein
MLSFAGILEKTATMKPGKKRYRLDLLVNRLYYRQCPTSLSERPAFKNGQGAEKE